MIISQGPALQRRLGLTLRKLREARAVTQKEVASALDWSAAKVMRIENSLVRVSPTDLRALLAHYGVDDQDRVGELVDMARAVKAMPLPEELDGVLLPDFMRYLSYEASAERVCNFQPMLLPGMLQTRPYALASIRALGEDGQFDDETVERMVEARVRRQELLDADDAPAMTFALDEAILTRGGGDKLMVEQLEHLKRVAQRPKVEIRVVPSRVAFHPGLLGSFVVLEFDDPRDDLVYLEDGRADLSPRDWHSDVAAYKARFARLAELATPADQFDAVVDRALASLDEGDR